MLEVALASLPLLLLLVSLLAGFYPGCEVVVRLAERIATRSARTTPAARQQPPGRPSRSAAHGGLLLALSLSGRAPPTAA